MRLSRIKIAGFKSFVDPTSVHFPSNLTGVVGPNGCGKSNIIDAVRWVMGEISAKHLRGDSMADVIFNGAGNRQPVSTASVELVFDNSDGTLSGAYSSFEEVSLKRQVSRDGTSTYFINGGKCRRKDITQLFLGTGLGSRSYAIIEQGMISRVIEAKPDDLRAFLEEAAGISKYKERRRETENRISHTRENLDRLNDLREEVEKQIRHLTRQAGVARRYREYKDQERRLKAELLALRLIEIDAAMEVGKHQLAARQNALEAVTAELRASEAKLEQVRAEHQAKADQLGEIQTLLVQAGAEARRVEQALSFARDTREQQTADLSATERSLEDCVELLKRDLDQESQLKAVVTESEPVLAVAREAEAEAHGAFLQAESMLTAWRERWEAFSLEVSEAGRKTMVTRARLEQLESALARLLTQQDRHKNEIQLLESSADPAHLRSLESTLDAGAARDQEARTRLETATAQLEAVRAQEERSALALDQAKSELQQATAAMVSLEAMQKAALGQGDQRITSWLTSKGLADSPRLAQLLDVERGWERAVETVLGDSLEAVVVGGLESIADWLGDLSGGALSLVTSAGSPHRDPATSGVGLASRLRSPEWAAGMLRGIRTAANLNEALSVVPALAGGESVITPEGIWLGPNWLRVRRDNDAHAGVIEREHALKELRSKAEEHTAHVESLAAALRQAREGRLAAEQERDEAQSVVNQAHRDWVQARSQVEMTRARLQQSTDRLQAVRGLLAETAKSIKDDEEQIRLGRSELEQGLLTMSQLDDGKRTLEDERRVLEDAVNSARQVAQQRVHEAQQAAIRLEAVRSQLGALKVGIERSQAQAQGHQERRDHLRLKIDAAAEPIAAMERELAGVLEDKLGLEGRQTLARQEASEVEHRLEVSNRERVSVEGRLEEARGALEAERFANEGLKVRREGVVEQFEKTRLAFEEVRAGLPDEASVATWEEQLSEVSSKIERLGAVNLASIDELKEQTERKEYLDKQFADLNEALATLEEAIRKIDRETRARFKDTFDRVNAGLQEKFPRLFDGGSAYLELIGDDSLSSGVAIMARPPGKRNVTISQLSGGEKALTAVALVFSIFELNPAPFCLLDEVDAPLDDRNVGRFCEIVRDMSQQVQFLFITHNKSTMELAQQLIGVTMNEPGVSRLVAVDVDEAVRMAAS
ncbi:MAG: chromosome segregation protein SMC [Steroidobacteraceae bacterium]